jgi:hypothetical protein
MIANYDERTESETPAALYNASNSINIKRSFVVLLLFLICW